MNVDAKALFTPAQDLVETRSVTVTCRMSQRLNSDIIVTLASEHHAQGGDDARAHLIRSLV